MKPVDGLRLQAGAGRRVAGDRIEWIREADRFAELGAAWDTLATAEPSPFSDHAWFRCWWEAFGGSGLQICAAWRGDELVGVLPLQRSRRSLAAMSNVHTPLFRVPARDDAARQALLDAVMDEQAPELALHPIPAEDPFLPALRAASRRHGRLSLVEPGHTSPIVDTAGSVDDYRRRHRSSLRTMLRRRRGLSRDHVTDFVVSDGSADFDRELEHAFAIEASGWKGQAGTAIISSPETRAFYSGLARAYRERDELRLAWLRVDDRPAAFNLCLRRGRRLYLLKTGFDAALARLTPGVVLQLETVEYCFEEGLVAYELLGDKAEWKRRLATDERAHSCVRSYRRLPLSVANYVYRRRARPMMREGSRLLRRS